MSKKIKLQSKYKQTDVIVGGEVEFSTEEARGMYKATTGLGACTAIPSESADREDNVEITRADFEQLMVCRDMVRSIAKGILITGGAHVDMREITIALNK